ncbi:unnamed protein product [Rotaria sp. Silwood1]|nr:unnamed protein product [Rotaria sp. Silwood1]
MNKTQLEPNEVIVEIKGIGLNPVDIQLAKIPGADFSGRIYKIGDEVFGLNLSIAGNGCLSQYIKLSENMSNDHTNNQKILIIGASGGVSHIACQIARVMNKYIVEICSSQNIEFVKEMGANEVIDYTKNDIVMASKQYGPYDIILDCVGGIEFIPCLNSDFLQSNQSIYLTIVGDKTS